MSRAYLYQNMAVSVYKSGFICHLALIGRPTQRLKVGVLFHFFGQVRILAYLE